MRQIKLLVTKALSISVLLTGLAVAGCNGGTGNSKSNGNIHEVSEPVSLTIATFSKALGNSPYHVAKNKGWLEQDPRLKGYKINYAEFNDRPAISAALERGELQVLFSAEVPAILCRAQGNDIRIVTLSANTKQNVLVPVASNIDRVQDLKGKTVAVLQGTSSHYGLLTILKSAGLQESNIKIQYMPPAEAKVAFETGKLNAWAVWPPFTEQQEVNGKGRVVEGGEALINSVMSVDQDFLKNNDDAIEAVVEAIKRAKLWIEQNPVDAQKIVALELGLDAKVVNRAFPRFSWKAKLTDAIVQDFQNKADFLAKADKTRNATPISVGNDLIDLRYSMK